MPLIATATSTAKSSVELQRICVAFDEWKAAELRAGSDNAVVANFEWGAFPVPGSRKVASIAGSQSRKKVAQKASSGVRG